MNRILVVEDEKSINDLIEMNLSEAGYDCVCCYDGEAAADILERESFDWCCWTSCCPRWTAMSCWIS